MKLAKLELGGDGPDGLLAATASTLNLPFWDDASARFSITSTYLGGQPDETRDIVTGDFDGDGFPEAAASSASNDWVEIFDVPLGGGPLGMIRVPEDVSSPVSLSAADFSPVSPATDLAVLARSGERFSVLLLYFFEAGGAIPSAPGAEPLRFTVPSSYLARGGDCNLNGDTWEVDGVLHPIPDIAVIRAEGTSSVYVLPPDGDNKTWTMDWDQRAGGHPSPQPVGLALVHMPGGETSTWDRITCDAALESVLCSYYKPGHAEIDSTVSYPLPGPPVDFACGDLDGSGCEDLAVLTSKPGKHALTVLLANPAGEHARDDPFHYFSAFAQERTIPCLMDVGFGHAGRGNHLPFLAAVDRTGEKLKVFFLDPDPAAGWVLDEETVDGLSRRPAGVRIADFDGASGDDIAVICNDCFYLIKGRQGETPVFGDPERTSLPDLLAGDPGFCERFGPGPNCAASVFPPDGTRMREHAAAANIDGLLLPDLVIPIWIDYEDKQARDNYLVVILNPGARGSADYSVRFYRTVHQPRQVTVANMNDDGALDLLVAGNESHLQIIFGDPEKPGNFLDGEGARIPAIRLGGDPSKPLGFEEAQTPDSSLLGSGRPWPYFHWPLAEWILCTHENQVLLYSSDGLEPAGGGGDMTPRFSDVPEVIHEGTEEDSEAESIYLGNFFPGSTTGCDFAITEEKNGKVIFFKHNGAFGPEGQSWERLNSIRILSPQHLATVDFPDGSSYLAIVGRARSEISLLRGADDAFNPVEPPIEFSPPVQKLPRAGMALGRRADGTWTLACGVDGLVPGKGECAVDLLPVPGSAEGIAGLGAQAGKALAERVPFNVAGLPCGILLLDVSKDGLLDLLVAVEPTEDSGDGGEESCEVNCYLGQGGKPSLAEEGHLVLSLAEPLVDWQGFGAGDESTEILVAGPAQAAIYSITPALVEPRVEWVSRSHEPVRGASWGTWDRRAGKRFVAILGEKEVRVECTGGEKAEPPALEGVDSSCLGVRDVDSDGMDDIVVVDRGAALLGVCLARRRAGGLSFAGPTETAFSRLVTPVGMGFLDANGDGKLDVVFGEADGGLFVFCGYGEGSFAAPEMLYAGPDLQCIETCDLDGDGIEETAFAATSVPGIVALSR